MRRVNGCPRRSCGGSLLQDSSGAVSCTLCAFPTVDPLVMSDVLTRNVPTVEAHTAARATGRTVPRLIERAPDDETMEAWR